MENQKMERDKISESLRKMGKRERIKTDEIDEDHEMLVDRPFCQKSLNYDIEDYWEIWPDETLKFNSENPANATLVFALNQTADKILSILTNLNQTINVTCCDDGKK